MENTVTTTPSNNKTSDTSRLYVALCWLIIFVIWAITRIDAYILADGLNTNNPDWSYYFFSAEYLNKHPLNAFLYLRSNPPLPQFILWILQQIFYWPFKWPVIQFTASCMSLITGYAIFTILRMYWNSAATCLITILFIANNDIISFEVSGLANTFYEIMGATILSLTTLLYAKQSKWVALPLICITFTKAAFTYLPIVGMALATITKQKYLRSISTITLLAVLLWAGKNYCLYKEFSFETSVSTGYNIVNRLFQTKTFKDFYQYTKSKGNSTCLIDTLGKTYKFDLHCPEFNEKRNVELGKKIDCLIRDEKENLTFCSLSNSGIMFELSRQMRPRYLDYTLHQPTHIFYTTWMSYASFWSNHRIYIHDQIDKIRAWPIKNIQKYWLIINILLFHSTVFFVLIGIITRHLPAESNKTFLFALIICLYYIGITSIGDCCENFRFRQAIIPLIIICNFLSLHSIFLLIKIKLSSIKKKP